MAKSKPRNRAKNRADPTTKHAKPPSDPELAAIREQRILPVVKDLQSPELKTRAAAASAIANIIEDPKCRKLLLREQIVKILLEQTLSDSSFETRTLGWGLLRNLALEEEADFAVHLYRQDILTAIEGVIKTIIQTIESESPPVSKLPKPQQDLLWNLTSSVISLLTTLSEAQDEITEAVSKLSTITNFLFGLLAFNSTPIEVQNDTLSCLTALTEDNKPLVEQIVREQNWLAKLIEIKDAGGLKAVAACGVLHNIFMSMQWFDHNAPPDGASDAVLIPTLVQSLDEAQKMVQDGTNGNSHSSPDQILQLALEITASIATSLQEALEHGAQNEKKFEGFEDEPEGALNNDEDGMDADGNEGLDGEVDDEEDDEMTQEQIEADMEMVTGPDAKDGESAIEELTLDSLVRLAAPKILLLASSKSASQEHAVSALNNISWTISSIDFSAGHHLDNLFAFWSELVQNIWSQIVSPVLESNTADIQLAYNITSLAWALSRSVKGAVKIQPDEQRKFMALYQASQTLDVPGSEKDSNKSVESEDAFLGLGVKCIGVLGSLALHPAPIELNREIGVFLLTVLAALPEAPAADAIEALNQIFDIYADKIFAFDEPVFWGDGFYKHLEEIQPKARKMAKAIDKRKSEELRSRADEAVLNLGRFLTYKRKEKAGTAKS